MGAQIDRQRVLAICIGLGTRSGPGAGAHRPRAPAPKALRAAGRAPRGNNALTSRKQAPHPPHREGRYVHTHTHTQPPAPPPRALSLSLSIPLCSPSPSLVSRLSPSSRPPPPPPSFSLSIPPPSLPPPLSLPPHTPHTRTKAGAPVVQCTMCNGRRERRERERERGERVPESGQSGERRGPMPDAAGPNTQPPSQPLVYAGRGDERASAWPWPGIWSRSRLRWHTTHNGGGPRPPAQTSEDTPICESTQSHYANARRNGG
jgi:hypothetical protein